MAQKFGMSWWGQQWLNALTNIDYSNRLPRGATYARKGAVLDIKLNGNKATAKVQGCRRTPYKDVVSVPVFPQKKIDELIDKILENPNVLARLLNRELSPQILDIARSINLDIFPKSWKDLDMQCSCPDWAVPCKHLAAVIYMLSREIDNNPFIVFSMHGVDFQNELSKHGITLDTDADIAVPQCATLFRTAAIAKTKPKPVCFRQIDFSRLHNITEPLTHLLTDMPAFYPQGNFREQYASFMKSVSKQASRVLAGKIALGGEGAEPYAPLKRSDTVRLRMDAALRLLASLDTADVDCDRKLPENEQLLLSVWQIHADYIADYNISVSALRQTIMVALQLLANGCVVPQIIAGGNVYSIRWLPAKLDAETREVTKALAEITPPQMLSVSVLDQRNVFIPENPSEHILSAIILWVMSQLPRVTFYDKVSKMFFNALPQLFDGVGETEIPGGVKSWLDRLFLSVGRYAPTLAVEETSDNGFSLSVSVMMGKNEVPLGRVLSHKRYEGERFAVLKELSLLSAFLPHLDAYVNAGARTPMLFSLPDFAAFLNDVIPAVRLLGVKVVLPKSLQQLIRPKASVRIAKREANEKGYLRLDELLMFDWRVALGDELVSEEEFYKMLKNARGLIKFKSGYIYVTEEDLARLNKAFTTSRALSAGQLLQAALTESFDSSTVEITDEVRRLISELTSQSDIPVPREINATLRPYQERGFSWMYRNMRIGFGSIIADDMGLGKTLQVITLLQKAKNDGMLDRQSAVIVVPTGLLTNWQSELARFAPQLSVFVYHGQQRDLKKFSSDILLTTYGVLRSDIDLLKKKKWQIAVIDEAQNIKNADTAQSKAVRSLPAATHIAMSGTPVENRLSEFWSVMDFANKGYLGNSKYFQETFAKPIQLFGDRTVAEHFRQVCAPFMMRRLKTDKTIINDLPDKIEQNESVRLTERQASLYEQTLSEAMKQIEGIESTDSKSLFKRQGLVLQMILALKQICNHPALFLKNGELSPEQSGKTVMLLDLLESIVESNQKVLVFTQFKEMGEMLQQMIAKRMGVRPLFLHGGCSIRERQQMVERFQKGRGDNIFLLSLKAAGTGLNLTAASHVIHYDLWWNPAVEAQATDRAYRIGQHQNVLVHRFITDNTFEERIDAMIQSKKHLAEMTVAAGESWIGKLSNKELHVIFERE